MDYFPLSLVLLHILQSSLKNSRGSGKNTCYIQMNKEWRKILISNYARQWNNIFKVRNNNKNYNLEFYIQQNYLSKMKTK